MALEIGALRFLDGIVPSPLPFNHIIVSRSHVKKLWIESNEIASLPSTVSGWTSLEKV